MITNENARELVKTLRDLAKRNVEERDKYGKYGLEKLIPDEEKAE